MRFSVQKGSFAAAPADCHIFGVFAGARRLQGEAAVLDRRRRGAVKALWAQAEFKAESGQVAVLPAGRKGRVVVVGLGDAKKVSSGTLKSAFAAAAAAAATAQCTNAAVALPDGVEAKLAAAAISEGCLLSAYNEQLYRTGKRRRETKPLDRVTIFAGEADLAAVRSAVTRGEAFAAATNFVRDLVNQPANRLTPRLLAREAKSIAAASSLVSCTVFGERELAKRKMNGILGVGRGSEEESQFIQLEYKPKTTRKLKKIALVGKGLTFDTGGISIKPAQGMELMKFDMGGAAAVLGAFRILSALQPNAHVLGYIGSAENMPDGRAIKPGDLLEMMSGLTVEVNNTDAEGRLVLADCLHFARQAKPDFIVDAATLTGACVIALGEWAAGLMSEDEELAALIQSASADCGERVWRLPLWDEHRKAMEGHVADLKNTGAREGGASTAAGFLSCFTEGLRWAHLDIAGPVWTETAKPIQPKGATGFGARLFYCIVERAAAS